ncbi:MAG: alpha/beta hydrolase [Actinobacteria bacterium]|nr:alpha/beta hydrolase [Actinomycetota bacterium]
MPTDGKRVDRFRHDGYELVYETHGEGPRVLVFIHGLLLDSNLNRGLAQALAANGNRVILLELLGHGRSDRPARATEHRMDVYAEQAIALLDHLEVEQAVMGGVSLGANVTLHAAAAAPDRIRAMLVEMPVLEWAAPAAGAVFVPMLLGIHFARPLVRLLARVARGMPRTGYGPVDSFMNSVSMDPREIAAVLHGMLIGPTAPPVRVRRQLEQPTLIIGHQRDYIHPFSDATNLADQLPNARLLRARSMFELRLRPTRLIGEIAGFLDEVWQPQLAGEVSSTGA